MVEAPRRSVAEGAPEAEDWIWEADIKLLFFHNRKGSCALAAQPFLSFYPSLIFAFTSSIFPAKIRSLPILLLLLQLPVCARVGVNVPLNGHG